MASSRHNGTNARGAAAHGVFESYGTGRSVTKAAFLAGEGQQPEVLYRFSIVLRDRALDVAASAIPPVLKSRQPADWRHA